MALFSWFNSSSQVDTALVLVAIVGAVVEAGVAVSAVINVHKEIEESRKRKLEKYIEIFACIAAFLFLAEAILGCRSSMLLAKEIEGLHKVNLELQAKLQPRTITPTQVTNFIFLTEKLAKFPVRITVSGRNGEDFNYAYQIRNMLSAAGFKIPDSDTNKPGGINVDESTVLFERGDRPEWHSVVLVTYKSNRTSNVRIIVRMQVEQTNNFTRPVVLERDREQVGQAITFVLKQIGVDSGWTPTITAIEPGGFQFLVLPKLQ